MTHEMTKGTIIACNVNAPGSWHDSRVARPIYEKLRIKTPKDFYLVTDTAFPRGTDQVSSHIRAPMKDGARLPDDPILRDQAMQFDRQLLSFRQTAEWGMRTLQGSFGRLRVPLPINYSDIRGDLLEVIARLFNLRARKVGHNQIRTVYLPLWQDDENYPSTWLHLESILFRDQRRNDRVNRFHLQVSEA